MYVRACVTCVTALHFLQSGRVASFRGVGGVIRKQYMQMSGKRPLPACRGFFGFTHRLRQAVVRRSAEGSKGASGICEPAPATRTQRRQRIDNRSRRAWPFSQIQETSSAVVARLFAPHVRRSLGIFVINDICNGPKRGLRRWIGKLPPVCLSNGCAALKIGRRFFKFLAVSDDPAAVRRF